MTIILAARTDEGVVFAYDLLTVETEPFGHSRTYMHHKVKPWKKDAKGKERAYLAAAGNTPYSMDHLVEQLQKIEGEPLNVANTWLNRMSKPPEILSVGFFKRRKLDMEPRTVIKKANARLAIAYAREGETYLAISENLEDTAFRGADRWGSGFGFDCYPSVQEKFGSVELSSPLSKIVKDLVGIVGFAMKEHKINAAEACKDYELSGLGVRILTPTGYAMSEQKGFCA